jgi:hypothetical protein
MGTIIQFNGLIEATIDDPACCKFKLFLLIVSLCKHHVIVVPHVPAYWLEAFQADQGSLCYGWL